MQTYNYCICRHGVLNPECPRKDWDVHPALAPYDKSKDRACTCEMIPELSFPDTDGGCVFILDPRCPSTGHWPEIRYVTKPQVEVLLQVAAKKQKRVTRVS